MAAINKNSEFEEIDEAEEEALLRSDDENEGAVDEDFLMNERRGVAMPGSDGEDDDDENDSDESDKLLLEYKNTLKELEKNKYSYDKYVRLCELSHATGELDIIREAYNRFAAVYPLSPELWLKYLRIEMSVAQSPSEIEQLEAMFRRSLKDYYSIDIALEFAAFASRCVEPLLIWNEIIGTYGLHCLKGQEFFKLYRKFIASNTLMSSSEKENAYVQSFLRELKYPLHHMEESYIEFKVFYEKKKTEISSELDWTAIDRAYFKAKEHLQLILPFEQKLESLEPHCYRERADVYTKYIKESDKFLDENVLQTLYERMVADCCLNVECWLAYLDFLDYRDEFGRPAELQDLPVFQQDALDVNNRALRNCTWSEKLYIKRIHLMEKHKKSREEIQEVLESSLSAGFQTAEPAVAIWMEYLTYLRRQTNWESEAECEILRKNFNLAWTILGQQWGVLADCNCEILQFWGRLEYGPLQDAKRGKELWTTVMESSDNATKSGLWIEFAQLEMRRDLEATRKVYRKALNSAGLDNPPVIAAAWERFERCNGTIKSLSTCVKECTEFSTQYQSRFATVDAGEGRGRKPFKDVASTSKGTKRKSIPKSESTQEKKPKTSATRPNATETRETAKHDAAFKEHENQEIDLTKDHLRIFLSNLDYNLTEEEVRAALPELKIVNVDLIRSANGKSRGFGYLEVESEAEVEKALALDRRSLHGRPLFISSVLRDKEKRQKFKYSDGLEPKKLFVRGLPHDATKDELEEIFAAFGTLTDVRLVYHKSGKFKNIAYVEYEDEASAKKAIMGTDQMEIRGHNISVAISAPPVKANAPNVASPAKIVLNAKRNKVFDQKPRMSLIPSAVRRKLTVGSGAASALPPPVVPPASTNGSTKTNEDFRKLLQK